MELSDLSLPSTWDVTRDFIVLLGRETQPLVESFLRIGQEHVIWRLEEEERDAELPEMKGVQCAYSRADLMSLILDAPGRLPAHVIVRGANESDIERATEASEAAQDAVRMRGMLRNTYAKHGQTWLKQGIRNLPALTHTPSVEGLFDAWQGKPCVIVSPGPSLSRNVALLPRIAEKALIIAGTHAAGALTKVGVAPDLLMAVDAGDLTSHLDAIDLEKVGAYVVGVTCQSDNFERPARRRFSVAGNGVLDDWIFSTLGEEAKIPCGGSVSCSALGLALRMGCDPIVLIGQDLSFPDGRAYAEETIDGDARVHEESNGHFRLSKPNASERSHEPLADGTFVFSRAEERIEVPGYHGGTVPTNQTFRAYLKWFEALAEQSVGSVRLVNATEGGARIEGMEQRTLEEMLDEWPEARLDVGAMLDRAGEGIDAEARRGRLTSCVDGLIASLRRSLELAARCDALADRALYDQGVLKKLGKEEGRLGKALKPIRPFSLIAQDEIMMAQERGRTARTLTENLAAARELYQIVKRVGGELYEPLIAARTELRRLKGTSVAA